MKTAETVLLLHSVGRVLDPPFVVDKEFVSKSLLFSDAYRCCPKSVSQSFEWGAVLYPVIRISDELHTFGVIVMESEFDHFAVSRWSAESDSLAVHF